MIPILQVRKLNWERLSCFFNFIQVPGTFESQPGTLHRACVHLPNSPLCASLPASPKTHAPRSVHLLLHSSQLAQSGLGQGIKLTVLGFSCPPGQRWQVLGVLRELEQ